MNNYSMTCSCGDVMNVQADSRDEAVSKLQGMMNAEAVSEHMAKKHPGDPVPPVSAVHADIAKNLVAA